MVLGPTNLKEKPDTSLQKHKKNVLHPTKLTHTLISLAKNLVVLEKRSLGNSFSIKDICEFVELIGIVRMMRMVKFKPIALVGIKNLNLMYCCIWV
jgi:hypothetical protein